MTDGETSPAHTIVIILFRVRNFFTRAELPCTRILIIESGSRALVEKLLPHLYEWRVPVDLVTCFGGLPQGLAPDAAVYRVTDYGTPEARRQLVRELRARHYSFAGMICSGESIMSKWKLMLFFRIPARFFIVNENGDYFWFHRDSSSNIREFSLARLGLTGAGAIRTAVRLLLFPFSVVFLLLWAFTAHSRRALRLAFARKTT
jgi:hypothetical protein